MINTREIKRVLWLCALTALGSTACSEPCYELSKRVCLCEKTEYEQRICVQGLSLAAPDQPVTEIQSNYCQTLLDTECTARLACEKIALGDFAACGLSEADVK